MIGTPGSRVTSTRNNSPATRTHAPLGFPRSVLSCTRLAGMQSPEENSQRRGRSTCLKSRSTTTRTLIPINQVPGCREVSNDDKRARTTSDCHRSTMIQMHCLLMMGEARWKSFLRRGCCLQKSKPACPEREDHTGKGEGWAH